MQSLINHIERSLYFGEKEVSKLTEEIMQIEGLTSRKVKSLLNNLCGLEDCSYLEFGTYKGATFCAAIYNNDINYRSSVFSLYGRRANTAASNSAGYLAHCVNKGFYTNVVYGSSVCNQKWASKFF